MLELQPGVGHAIQPGAHLLHASTSPLSAVTNDLWLRSGVKFLACFTVIQARNFTPLCGQRSFVGSPEPDWAPMLPATSTTVLPAQPSLSNAVLPAQPYLFSNAVLPAQHSLFIPDMPSSGRQEEDCTWGESPLTTAPFTVTSS